MIVIRWDGLTFYEVMFSFCLVSWWGFSSAAGLFFQQKQHHIFGVTNDVDPGTKSATPTKANKPIYCYTMKQANKQTLPQMHVCNL